MMLSFDSYNLDHVKAYRKFRQTGVWPVEHDVSERCDDLMWVTTIQGRLCEAFVEEFLGPFTRAPLVNLRNMATNSKGHIESMSGVIDRLWEMNVRPGKTIEVVKGGSHCIIKLDGNVRVVDLSEVVIMVKVEQ
jgi:hypothetical protein